MKKNREIVRAIKKIVTIIIIFAPYLYSVERNYITVEEFKKCADHIIVPYGIPPTPTEVKAKDIVYVTFGGYSTFFHRIFPRIKNPIILITNNGDLPTGYNYKSYLDDPRIIMWFGHNCEIVHPKFYPIPIGLHHEKLTDNHKLLDLLLDDLEKNYQEKKPLLYMNISTGYADRSYVYDLFKNKPFVVRGKHQPWHEYLAEMAQYRYVLSPFGNGIACFRTWEALLVGSIPVVKRSGLDQLYEDLPVIIVHDWLEVTEEFLEKKYQEIKNKKFNREKLFMDYWIKTVLHFKQ